MRRAFLESLVSRALSQRQIAQFVGCSQTNVRYWLRKYSLSTLCRRKAYYYCLGCGKELDYDTRRWNKFCNIACFQAYRYWAYIAAWLRGDEPGGGTDGTISNYVRKYLFERTGGKCEKCDWAEVNPTTGKKPLTVNHKDGDSRNHRPDNVELLCPNCHSLTPTFGSLNNGRGRYHRRKAALIQRALGQG